MAGAWLKCDHCNKDLAAEVGGGMQLAIRFKPSVFPRALEPLHPDERRLRCRSCGWVNVFVPITVAGIEPARNSLLTPSWRRVTLKS